MKLFKNIRVTMDYKEVEESQQTLSEVLFEDEEVVGYFESAKALLAFTSKRIIYIKRNEEAFKACYYYSYRNIAAYGVNKNVLTLSLINAPEYSRFLLKVKNIEPEKNEAGEIVSEGLDAQQKSKDL